MKILRNARYRFLIKTTKCSQDNRTNDTYSCMRTMHHTSPWNYRVVFVFRYYYLLFYLLYKISFILQYNFFTYENAYIPRLVEGKLRKTSAGKFTQEWLKFEQVQKHHQHQNHNHVIFSAIKDNFLPLASRVPIYRSETQY